MPESTDDKRKGKGVQKTSCFLPPQRDTHTGGLSSSLTACFIEEEKNEAEHPWLV